MADVPTTIDLPRRKPEASGKKVPLRSATKAAEEAEKLFPKVPDLPEPKKKREEKKGGREGRAEGEHLALEPAAWKKRYAERAERLEAAAERERQKSRGAYEAAIRYREKHPPKPSEMKKDPELLRQAVRRGQVKMIAKRAAPGSKDTADVFTAAGKRYAMTDTYKPTARERVSLVHERAARRGVGFWEKNKTTIVVSALVLTAGYLLYTTATAAARGKRISQMEAWRRQQHKTGYWGSEPAFLAGHYPGHYPGFHTGAPMLPAYAASPWDETWYAPEESFAGFYGGGW
jgi:hypothetical protein